jgi:hypothetical protein
MDLDAYRLSAEAFLSELTGEYYRHYAGLKEQYAIEPIYAQHGELFTRRAVDGLREHAARSPAGSDEHRRLTMLVDFAVEGYVGEAGKQAESELALREARTMLELDDRRIGYRESSAVQANEPDPGRREMIERARLDAVSGELGELYREVIERQHACARELGWESYRAMCAECKLLDLDALQAQCSEFSRASEPRYAEVLEPELRRTLGFGLDRFRRGDLPRFFRAPDDDRAFPGNGVVASFERTMRGLGIEVGEQPGVVFDVEPRPNKSQRAFCAPVRPPHEVYLVLTPVGGREDYSTLFHEGGHTEHYVNVRPDLPFEYRYLGDNSVTEAFAFLFDHLVATPEWLRRHIGAADPAPLVAHARAVRLIYLRRYAAKLAYELELHAGVQPLPSLAPRYADLLGRAVGVAWPQELFLQDVDAGFYCVCYLQAWALETYLRAHLRERFGPDWFDSPEAGELLRGLWREGQRLRAGELLGELTGATLDFGVLLADLGLET